MSTKTDLDGSYPLLLWAIQQNDLKLCKQALLESGDANVKDPIGTGGFSALHHAVKIKSLPIAALLLKHGARINAKDSENFTPLMAAAHEGMADFCKLFVVSGANLEAVDKHGRSVLVWACARGHTKAAKVLLDSGADVDSRDDDGASAMMRAAQFGQVDAMKLLSLHGASVHVQNSKGEGPLHYVAAGPPIHQVLAGEVPEDGHIQACRLLLKLRCRVTQASRPDLKSETPLHIAAQSGQFEIVQQMIRAGADVHALDRGTMTPLMRAASRSYSKKNADQIVKIIDALIAAGSELDKLGFGGTALHIAAKSGDADACFHLIKIGARVDLKAAGVTPAGMATRHGHKVLGAQIRAFTSSLQAVRAVENVMAKTDVARRGSLSPA